jgi:hypothetical protein
VSYDDLCLWGDGRWTTRSTSSRRAPCPAYESSSHTATGASFGPLSPHSSSSCASARISFVAYLAVVDSISNSKLTFFSCSFCLSMMLQGDSEGGVLDAVQHRRGHV